MQREPDLRDAAEREGCVGQRRREQGRQQELHGAAARPRRGLWFEEEQAHAEEPRREPREHPEHQRLGVGRADAAEEDRQGAEAARRRARARRQVLDRVCCARCDAHSDLAAARPRRCDARARLQPPQVYVLYVKRLYVYTFRARRLTRTCMARAQSSMST